MPLLVHVFAMFFVHNTLFGLFLLSVSSCVSFGGRRLFVVGYFERLNGDSRPKRPLGWLQDTNKAASSSARDNSRLSVSRVCQAMSMGLWTLQDLDIHLRRTSVYPWTSTKARSPIMVKTGVRVRNTHTSLFHMSVWTGRVGSRMRARHGKNRKWAKSSRDTRVCLRPP